MELKLGFVVVCLWALTITHTEAGIPKCCLSTKTGIPLGILLRVQRWDVQQSSGACDIPALVLHVKDLKRPVCAHPKVKRVLMRVQQRRKRSHKKATF